jgi:hypothetical protein
MGLIYIHPNQFIRGLSESRYRNYETNDCVVKAFAILFGISYDEAHGFSRGFFNRPERNGPVNFSNSMMRMISNPNFSFNGKIKRIRLNESLNIQKIQNSFKKGVYLILTFNHVSVLCEGVFVDHQFILKPKDLVYEVFEFSNFPHHDEIKSKIQKQEDSKVGWFFIFAVILTVGLFDQSDKVERDLIKLKSWIKNEILNN